MSAPKHTPGPWRVYPHGSSVPAYDVCDRIVADVITGRSAHQGPSDADAQLIASAPDLLADNERLKARVAELEEMLWGPQPSKPEGA